MNETTITLVKEKLNAAIPDTGQWSPLLLHQMFPELDKAALYEIGKANLKEAGILTDSEDRDFDYPSRNAGIINDLPQWVEAYDSQGSNGCCTAFAATTLMEFYARRNGWGIKRFSRAFTYILGNIWEGQNLPFWGLLPGGNDWGIWPDTAGRILTQYGCCPETDLPYDESHLYFDPKQNRVQLLQHLNPKYQFDQKRHLPLASGFRLKAAVKNLYSYNINDWVTTNIDNYLRAGFPCVYSFKWPLKMDQASGIIARADGDTGAGHSVVIIGKQTNYSPGPGHPTGNWYIFRNSHRGFGINNPLGAPFKGCGLMHEHDVYWRHIQSLFISW